MVRKDEFGIPIRKSSDTTARARSRSRSPDRRRPKDDERRRDYRDDDRRRSYDRYDKDDRGRKEDRERPRDDYRRSRGPTTHSSRGELAKPLADVPAGMPVPASAGATSSAGVARMIEVIANDRLGGKVRVKCSPDDTVGDLKKLIAFQKGTKPEKIILKKWYTIYKDHVKLSDYEIHDGMQVISFHQRDATHDLHRSLEMH